MEYGLPRHEADSPEQTVPFSARIHPFFLAVLTSLGVGLSGALTLYLWLRFSGVSGWAALDVFIIGFYVVVALTLVGFFGALAWGIQSRRRHRHSLL